MTQSWNTTSNVITVQNSIDPSGLIFIILFVAVAAFLVFAISSVERYAKLYCVINYIVNSVKYAVYGTGISSVGYGIYLSICMITSASKSGLFDPMWIVYSMIIYIALVAIGYVGNCVASKISEIHTEYMKIHSPDSESD